MTLCKGPRSARTGAYPSRLAPDSLPDDAILKDAACQAAEQCPDAHNVPTLTARAADNHKPASTACPCTAGMEVRDMEAGDSHEY